MREGGTRGTPRVAGFSIGTQSGRTMQLQATTHAERATALSELEVSICGEGGSCYVKCRLIKTRPEPDFRYFSNSKALYLFAKAVYENNSIGLRFFVAGTWPFLCRSIRSLRSSVQPVYGFPSAHSRIYT